MYRLHFEKLLLEIHAAKAGWTKVDPPTLRGESGRVHRFSFLARDDNLVYGFDIYKDVTKEEVLSSYMKRTDTRAVVVMISLSGRPNKEVASVADDSGVTILGPGDVDSFFDLDNIELNVKE